MRLRQVVAPDPVLQGFADGEASFRPGAAAGGVAESMSPEADTACPVGTPAAERPMAGWRPGIRGRASWGLVLFVLSLAGLRLAATMPVEALLGWDTYPLIAASRIQSWGDLAGTVRERLMDGQYPSDLQRPLLNLSIALDHVLWGLEPSGFLRTNLLWVLAAAAALFALHRRLQDDRPRWGSWLVLLGFLVWPCLGAVLPVVARRPEAMLVTFVALTVRLQLSPSSLARRLPLAPALLGALALASKETAFVVLPPLCFAAVLLFSPRPTRVERWLHAARAMVPHAAIVALFIAWRCTTLGGFGGSGMVDYGRLSARLPARLGQLAALTVPEGAPAWLVVTALAASLAVVAMSGRGAGRGAAVPPAGGAVLGAVWVGAAAVAYASVAVVQPWYLVLPAAGLSLLAADASELLLGVARRPRRRGQRGVALAAFGLLLVSIVAQVRHSPLLRTDPVWAEASRTVAGFLTRLERRIEAAPGGSVVEAAAVPRWFGDGTGSSAHGVAGLTDHSIQAWAELTWPHRRIRVASFDAETPSAGAGEVVVLCRPPGRPRRPAR